MKKLVLFITVMLFCSILFAQNNEKQGYIGLVLGPSIPVSDFADNSTVNETAGRAMIGYTDNLIDFGYRIYKNFGISTSLLYSQYDIADTGSEDLWWMVVGVSVGPMITIPLFKKVLIDLKPNISFVSANYLIDGYSYPENSGAGFGVDLKATIRYNLFKRWCLLAECGYLTSDQKFGSGRKMKFQVFNIGLGIAFRF